MTGSVRPGPPAPAPGRIDTRGAEPARGTQAARLYEAARDFEAILLHQVLRAMRRSLPVGGPFAPGTTQQLYRDLLDEAVAKGMSRAGGLGLADLLVRDLVRRLPDERNPSSPSLPAPISSSRRGERPEAVR